MGGKITEQRRKGNITAVSVGGFSLSKVYRS